MKTGNMLLQQTGEKEVITVLELAVITPSQHAAPSLLCPRNVPAHCLQSTQEISGKKAHTCGHINT